MDLWSRRSQSHAKPQNLRSLLRGFCQSSCCKVLELRWVAEQRAGDNLSGDCTQTSRLNSSIRHRGLRTLPPPGTALSSSAADLDVLLRNVAIISSEKMKRHKPGTCFSF